MKKRERNGWADLQGRYVLLKRTADYAAGKTPAAGFTGDLLDAHTITIAGSAVEEKRAYESVDKLDVGRIALRAEAFPLSDKEIREIRARAALARLDKSARALLEEVLRSGAGEKP